MTNTKDFILPKRAVRIAAIAALFAGAMAMLSMATLAQKQGGNFRTSTTTSAPDSVGSTTVILSDPVQDSTIAAAWGAIAADPALVAEYQKIIAIYKARKLPEQEHEVATKMMAANAGSPIAWFTYADVMLDNSEPDTAIFWLQRALIVDPQFVRAHTLLAEAWGMMDSTDRSLAHLDTAITLNPRFAQAYLQRANLFSKLKRYTEAAQDMQSLVELIPEDVGNWIRLGTMLAKAGNHRDAAEAFRTIMAMRPTMPDPLFRFAEESVAAGNSEEGMHAYEKFMLTFPTDSRALEAERRARAMGGGRP
ncbi:MAG: tetratricopeptide repeat protein [Armatimonadetes bacterium]|nr:tetratricopeptide repeat protein [Armatimonadota bacterium]